MTSLATICLALAALLQNAPASQQIETPASAPRAALFDELTPLYSDSDASAGEAEFRTDSPLGSLAGVYVLVSGLPPKASVEWKLAWANYYESDTPAILASYRLIDVPVEQNTGLSRCTEALDGKTNPYVIRKAPFRVFEALEPIEAVSNEKDAKRIFAVPADENGVLALRLELPIPADGRLNWGEGTGVALGDSSLWRYAIKLASGDWRKTLKWEIAVYNVAIPPLDRQHFGFTNWFTLGGIAQRHNLEKWSEPFWEMLGRYADLMARGRQNTFMISWRDFAAFKDGKLEFNRERLARYIKLFRERGFTRLEGGHFAGRHEGVWESPRLDFTLTGSDVTMPQGRAELTQLLAEVRNVLAELHLPPECEYLQHLSDEPIDENAAAYKTLAEIVRRELPGVKTFDATMSQSVVGAVDVWCPQVQEYQRRRDFFEQRRAAGDRIWVYTCLSPGGPWLNRLLDQERLRPVYLGWSLAKYDLAGFLHWGFNHYRSGVDPYEKSCVEFPKAPKFLPAGDSHVVYPGKNGPLSSVRFEAHRIGMEDAELLLMLREYLREDMDELVNRVLRGYDDYEKDVKSYRATRREMLDRLSTLEALKQTGGPDHF